ncbi:hypothetical protein BBJ28_00005482 [Nothophytophthora sp. Chile5]|nr:hypothetical protein BBJ28_00005482 [Nothophytophthora sp. Chile5]
MQTLVGAAALGVLLLVAWVTPLWDPASLRGDEQSNEAHASAGFAHMFATKTMYWNQREAKGDKNDAALMRALVALPALAETPNRALFRQELQLIQTQIVPFVDDLPFDIALYRSKHNWCSLMTKALARSVDYLDDLKEFYLIGAGYTINYEMAAVLLRDIFAAMKARATDDSALAGNFFFAHAETTLPLMTLMGYGDRSRLLADFTKAEIASRAFRTSVLAPFAANVEFRLLQRKARDMEYYVQILVNEKEAEIPGCGRIFCKLSDLERQWHYYLKTYDFQQDCQ